MFTPRILKGASRELERLDHPVARRIVQRIRWLAENIENIKPEALKGDLAGLFKLREGDYRIIYEIVYKLESTEFGTFVTAIPPIVSPRILRNQFVPAGISPG